MFYYYSQEALERIKNVGILKVGVLEQDAFPFVFKNSEKINGYMIQRAKELATLLDAKLEILVYPNIDWAKNALNLGDIQIIFHKIFHTLSNGLDTFLLFQ